jgi:hypothetical protein
MKRAVAEAGAFDLAVNAMSPKGRFGGGDLITTDDDAMSPYLEQLLPEVLHEQGRSAWTHELVVTPIGDRWTP